MYLSPLWEDTHANFKVDYNRNLWNDFGTGEGGSIIDLVARMENCSIAEAIRKLAYESGNTETILPNEQKPTAPKISRIEILSVGELEHLALVEYLRDRQIDLHRPAQFRNRPKTKRSQHSVH
ncbi:MAG: CHC2 zinc finger domain-containing protein [Rikenellaceae bacterium]|nr:CHC2 zinc finger domain-containing protein [Rikenellaceae bacterium]